MGKPDAECQDTPKASQGWPVWMVKAVRGAAHSSKCKQVWMVV